MADSLEKSQNQQLAEYIMKNLKKGYTPDALKYSLLTQGYSRTSVEKAIETANKQLALEAPKMQEKPHVKVTLVDDNEMRQKVAEQDAAGAGPIRRFFRKIFG